MQMARDIAACMYYTGIDPFTKEQVNVEGKGYCPGRKSARRRP